MAFDDSLIFLKTHVAQILYRLSKLLSPEKPVSAGSQEEMLAQMALVLNLSEAGLLLEYQMYCKSEKRAKRVPLEHREWFLGRNLPLPFRQDEIVMRGDLMALTAGGVYNRNLVLTLAEANPVTVANYLMLDRGDFIAPKNVELIPIQPPPCQ